MSDTELQQRSRSPAYPYLNLRTAAELIDGFYKKHRHNRIPVSIALKDMGYSSTGGTALRVLASLNHFGLIETDGSKTSKRLWISELGKSIVWENPSKPGARLEALRQAALLPEIHKWVYERYALDNNQIPSDEVLAYDLVNELGFLANTVDSFIKVFKETYTFAQLGQVDRQYQSGNEDEDQQRELESPVITRSETRAIPHVGNDERELTTLLTRGKVARLIIPSTLNLKDFDLLIRWLGMLSDAQLYQEE